MCNKISKFFVSALLIIIVLCSFSVINVSADETNKLNGDGSIDNPYQICDKDDLLYFSESVNSGNSYYKQYVQLMNDIDMQNVDMSPIGEFGSGMYFWGTFDGAGHVIRNLSIVSENNAGLFGQLGGEVMNLGIESGCIFGGKCNGAISSHAASRSALIINCYNKAKVYASYRAGGIADNFDGIILNCWSDCELDAPTTGGIVSYTCRTINFCYSTQALKPGNSSCGLDSEQLSVDDLYKQSMADRLNTNLSCNFFYDIRSNIDATKLLEWKYLDGDIVFSNHNTSISNSLKYKPLVFHVLYIVIVIVVFVIFACYLFLFKKKHLRNNSIIFAISNYCIISSLISFIILTNIFRGYGFNEVFFKDTKDTFMDFYNSVYDSASRQPYEHSVIYPPLCNVIYYIASRFVSSRTFSGVYHFPGGGDIKNLQGIQIAFVLYSGLIFAILLYAINLLLNKWDKYIKILSIISCVCAFPFLYALERGNIILLSFVLILLYAATYNSNNKFIREIGLISLAIGGVIKIYPAIFGLILIADKRYKAAIRTVIYGLIFFFVPFAFFGGTSGLMLFLKNITGFAGGSGGISHYTFDFNPGGLYSYISLATGYDFSYTKWVSVVLGVFLVFSSFIEKTRWKKASMLTCSMICIMPNASAYAMIYMIIPWFLLLNFNENRLSKLEHIYNILYISIFSVIPMGQILRTEYYDNSNFVRGSALFSTVVITLITLIHIVDFSVNHFSKKVSMSILCTLFVFLFLFSIVSNRLSSGLSIDNGIYIDLTVNDSNERSKYIVSGLDSCKDGYTWTSKRNVLFSYLRTEPGNDYILKLNIHDTYYSDSLLQEIVVYDDNIEIYRCVTRGESSINIPIHSEKNKLKLRIELPVATNPYTYEHIEDRRSLALQLDSIELQSC